MTKALRTALVLGVAFVGVAARAAPSRPESLADLRRQEAGLQDRIARMELDRLVAKVDGAASRRQGGSGRVDRASRELAAYAY